MVKKLKINESLGNYGESLRSFIGYSIDGVIDYLEKNGFYIKKERRYDRDKSNVFGNVYRNRSDYIDMRNDTKDISIRLFLTGNGKGLDDFVIAGKDEVDLNVESTKRRSRVKCSRMNEARQEIINYLDWNELDDRQKEQALDILRNSKSIYEIYNDSIMDDYHYYIEDLASDLEKETGVTVNTDKLYWQSNSHGPYPDWNLRQVFDEYEGHTPDYTDFSIKFNGGGTVIDFYFYVYNKETGYWEDIDEIEEFSEYTDRAGIEYIKNICNKSQKFIDDVWEEVYNVCTSYPDDEWILDYAETNNIDCEIGSDGDVISC